MARNAGIKVAQAKRRRKYLCLSCLVVIGITVVARRIWTTPLSGASALTPTPVLASAAPPLAEEKLRATHSFSPPVVTWSLRLQRDVFDWDAILPSPMRPAGLSATSLQGHAREALHLAAIIGGGSPRAMVNGELLKSGDEVRGFTIIRIERTCIVVAKDGAEVEVCLRVEHGQAQSLPSRNRSGQGAP